MMLDVAYLVVVHHSFARTVNAMKFLLCVSPFLFQVLLHPCLLLYGEFYIYHM